MGHGSSSQRVCNHCGCINHTVETCFMKHGYPPGYNYKSSKASINNAIASTPVDTSGNSPQDSYKYLVVIQDQYNHIIQLPHQQKYSLSPVVFEATLIYINLVSNFMDAMPEVY